MPFRGYIVGRNEDLGQFPRKPPLEVSDPQVAIGYSSGVPTAGVIASLTGRNPCGRCETCLSKGQSYLGSGVSPRLLIEPPVRKSPERTEPARRAEIHRSQPHPSKDVILSGIHDTPSFRTVLSTFPPGFCMHGSGRIGITISGCPRSGRCWNRAAAACWSSATIRSIRRRLVIPS